MKNLGWGAVFVFLLVVNVHAAEPTGRYKKIVDWMERLHTAHSAYTHIHPIGLNDEGTELMAMRVSLNPTVSDATKVAHLIVGTHHGNELKAPEFTMRFLEKLLQRYASNEGWSSSLANTEWEIIPVLNVTGYNSGNRYEYAEDPNRDYPGPCRRDAEVQLQSIKTLIAFMQSRIFTGSVTVHGYVGTLTFPWGMYADSYETLDHELYETITRNAASINGYQYGTHADAIYPCNGSFEDYVYWKHGMWSLLLELESGSEADIEKTIPAVAKFFDQLDSSPSTQHLLNVECTRSNGPDLRIE